VRFFKVDFINQVGWAMFDCFFSFIYGTTTITLILMLYCLINCLQISPILVGLLPKQRQKLSKKFRILILESEEEREREHLINSRPCFIHLFTKTYLNLKFLMIHCFNRNFYNSRFYQKIVNTKLVFNILKLTYFCTKK
jgi:hypothetical protein